MKVMVFDGINGAGKSTLIKAFENKVRATYPELRIARYADPGSTEVAERIRKLVKDPELPMAPGVQLLLYAAARLSLWNLIKDHEIEIDLVLLDRWIHSTICYQGIAVGDDKVEELHRLFSMSFEDIDLSVILDVPAELAATRAAAAKGQDFKVDRFEAKGLAFQKQLRDRYRTLGRYRNTAVVDVSNPDVEVNLQKIWAVAEVYGIV